MVISNNITTYVSRKCYFQLTYFDYEFLYPKVDTVVYLGNASELKDKLPHLESISNLLRLEACLLIPKHYPDIRQYLL